MLDDTATAATALDRARELGATGAEVTDLAEALEARRRGA